MAAKPGTPQPATVAAGRALYQRRHPAPAADAAYDAADVAASPLHAGAARYAAGRGNASARDALRSITYEVIPGIPGTDVDLGDAA